jgi:hypothetical protein
MFMPHFGQGGRTSKDVIVSLLVGRERLLVPPGSVIDLEIAFDHCHSNVRWRDQSLMSGIDN